MLFAEASNLQYIGAVNWSPNDVRGQPHAIDGQKLSFFTEKVQPHTTLIDLTIFAKHLIHSPTHTHTPTTTIIMPYELLCLENPLLDIQAQG